MADVQRAGDVGGGDDDDKLGFVRPHLWLEEAFLLPPLVPRRLHVLRVVRLGHRHDVRVLVVAQFHGARRGERRDVLRVGFFFPPLLLLRLRVAGSLLGLLRSLHLRELRLLRLELRLLRRSLGSLLRLLRRRLGGGFGVIRLRLAGSRHGEVRQLLGGALRRLRHRPRLSFGGGRRRGEGAEGSGGNRPSVARSVKQDGLFVAAPQKRREGFRFRDVRDVIRRDVFVLRARLFGERAAHQRRQRSRDRDVRQRDAIGRFLTRKQTPTVRGEARVDRGERRLDLTSRASVAVHKGANKHVEGVSRILHPRVNRRRARGVRRGRVQGSRGRAGSGDCVRCVSLVLRFATEGR